MIGGAFYSQLAATSGVTAIVGTRIYHEIGLDGLFPLIVISSEESVDDSINVGDLVRYTVTVSCQGLTSLSAETLGAAVKTALNRQTWSGDSTTVKSCLLTGGSNSAYSDSGDASKIYYAVDLDFSVLAR